MRIIFSKNRAAQLDLLLRSLDQHAWREETRVIWYADTRDHLAGYLLLDSYGRQGDADYKGALEPPERILGRITPPELFDRDLRVALAFAGPLVTFFCDDDVVIRNVPYDPSSRFRDEELLTFSWRLDAATQEPWRWEILPRTDHGYPGSIDGHVFRTADVLEMIGTDEIADPTMLETVLAARCEERAHAQPLMGAYPKQVLVGVPVNRVSERSGCPHGEYFPQDAVDLNAAFLNGYRLDPRALDFDTVTSCHHEVEFAYAWKKSLR